ncbi:MAG TPA: hypothetical protein VFA98_09690 [Thermoanaerobaculia bacterium]|nr:hypothetical protein [Thermoanaerobaculia bacterium]
MNERDTGERLTTSEIAAASRAAEAPGRDGRGTAVADEERPGDVEARDERPGHERAQGQTRGGEETPLFAGDEADRFRAEWDAIQIAFVDEPRRSVERADELVAQMIQRLAEIFADERTRLEAPWSRGEQVSTEKLRVALQTYRSFFGRLLAA